MSVSYNQMANAIRFLSADAVEKAKSGHPGMPLGMADVATVLFKDFLKFDSSNPDWFDRDRFVLSAGHGSMLLYSLLYLTGYKQVTLEEIKNFRSWGSVTAGHPEYGHTEGVETTTGPLGQGIATAVGMAMAEKLLNTEYGADVCSHHTYTIVGDGCLMEGISQEAITLAGHLKLNKLIVLWDDNSICIDGSTDTSTSENQKMRFEAAGWFVQQVDAYNHVEITEALKKAQESQKPSMIACKSIIGYGAPTKSNSSSVHGSPLGKEEIVRMRESLDWHYDEFFVPEEIIEAWRQTSSKGIEEKSKWEKRLIENSKHNDFMKRITGKLPENWQNSLKNLVEDTIKDKPSLATRVCSGKVLEELTKVIPALISGSADLTGSVNTKTSSTKSITPDDFTGRYIHYGIREHAMAAVMNGLALHDGFIPYSGTFLVFADYMRGAMRLSALMGLRVIYVLTHDSIGVGEDGPTHQPVETLASLRCLPNFNLLRPADLIETIEAWEIAIQSTKNPSGIVLTRQNLPTLRSSTKENLTAKGGYVISPAKSKPIVTIIATGSEVHLGVEAQKQLWDKNIDCDVVSMPSFFLFDKQSQEYKDQILPKDTLKVAVEAAIEYGWHKYIGTDGIFVGMNGFGASAPAPILFEKFGITSQNIVQKIVNKLSQ